MSEKCPTCGRPKSSVKETVLTVIMLLSMVVMMVIGFRQGCDNHNRLEILQKMYDEGRLK